MHCKLYCKSYRIQLTPREGCTKISLKGIFIGAKVVRGPDWEWGNQDGGRGIKHLDFVLTVLYHRNFYI